MSLYSALKVKLSKIVTDLVATPSHETQTITSAKPVEATAACQNSLQKIYTLENVDISTVKLLEQKSFQSTKNQETVSSHQETNSVKPCLHLQLRLPLSAHLSGNLTPCHAQEPLEQLTLSSALLPRLKKLGFKTIGDLLYAKKQISNPLDVLPLGHKEELYRALNPYLNREEERAQQSHLFDINAFLRRAFVEQESFEAIALLTVYRLDELPLYSPYEKDKVHRISAERQSEIAKTTLEKLRTCQSTYLWIKERWQHIVEASVSPWLLKQAVIAKSEHLQQQLKAHCIQTDQFDKLFFLIKDYFKKEPWLLVYQRDEEGFYYRNKEDKELLDRLRGCIKSYFYREDLSYNFDQLKIWVLQELASEWVDCPATLFMRYLQLSKLYELYYSEDKQLMVYIRT